MDNITIKELSVELNVTKQSIFKHLKNLPDGLSIIKDKNKFLLSPEVVDFLKNEFKNDNKVDDNLTFLKQELNKKDVQLQEKDNQIKELHNLLDQQQKLQLHTQALLNDLRLTIEEKQNDTSTNDENFSTDEKPKKWWQIWK